MSEVVYFEDKDNQLQALVGDLCAFARRVAKDENASPAELSILPEIVRTLLGVEDIR